MIHLFSVRQDGFVAEAVSRLAMKLFLLLYDVNRMIVKEQVRV
ncbi:MAG: hypothetical protein PHY64_04960 [Eubacteriales bacterium]|nr:hypothetical protein [Eubacteriales bacterium]